jgi:hypothetical protein
MDLNLGVAPSALYWFWRLRTWKELELVCFNFSSALNKAWLKMSLL